MTVPEKVAFPDESMLATSDPLMSSIANFPDGVASLPIFIAILGESSSGEIKFVFVLPAISSDLTTNLSTVPSIALNVVVARL